MPKVKKEPSLYSKGQVSDNHKNSIINASTTTTYISSPQLSLISGRTVSCPRGQPPTPVNTSSRAMSQALSCPEAQAQPALSGHGEAMMKRMKNSRLGSGFRDIPGRFSFMAVPERTRLGRPHPCSSTKPPPPAEASLLAS